MSRISSIALIALAASAASVAAAPGSCVGSCSTTNINAQNPEGDCYCGPDCALTFGAGLGCCADATTVCADTPSPTVPSVGQTSNGYNLQKPPTGNEWGTGSLSFRTYPLPAGARNAAGSAEPTIGIPWNTDNVFIQSYASTHRASFESDGSVTWTDVTPLGSIINIDPMLHADPYTGRIWAGGLAGACSTMWFSDNDGGSWTPLSFPCNALIDHQSYGSGPPAITDAVATAGDGAVVYYCSQLAKTQCLASFDGGVTWPMDTVVLGACGGLHGHIRTSPVTGTAVVPHASCGGKPGFAFTETNGAVWNSRVLPHGVYPGEGFDPSIGFSVQNGWMYYGFAGKGGVFMSLSKDEGLSWETIGQGHGAGAEWFNVGATYSTTIVHADMSDVQAGDDDRAVIAFMGLEEKAGGYAEIHQCNVGQAAMVWQYYVAFTYDAAQTWEVQRVSADPVQIGGIWDGGGGEPCRNLLDFNDLDIDSTGRVYVGFADGCVGDCATVSENDRTMNVDGTRAAYGTLFRQHSGKGLFAAYDL